MTEQAAAAGSSPPAEFARHWAERTGEPWQLRSAKRIYGGASRETWLVDLGLMDLGRGDGADGGDAGEGETCKLIYRRVQDNALIDTEMRVEFAALQSVQDTGLPVPQPLALEEDAAVLGAPFAVMSVLPGEPANPFAVDPYGDSAESVGTDFWRHMGRLAALDAEGSPLARCLDQAHQAGGGPGVPEPHGCWRRELDHWRGVIREDSMGAEPVLEAALAWLQAHPPPPPPRLALVHGDFRSGNVLHQDGALTAILDWEMAHLGDPLEDVAWSASRLWSPHAPHPPGGLIPRERALRLWAQASGQEVDPVRLRWWQIMACVKGVGIWISAGREFLEGRNTDPVNLFSSWVCTPLHLREMLDLLREEAA